MTLSDQRGHFKIARRIVMDDPEQVAETFIKMRLVVLKCELLAEYDSFHYFAYSSLFDVIVGSEIAPEYDLTVIRDDQTGEVIGVSAERR